MSFSNLVSFESRYGTKLLLFLFSESIFIQFPNVSKLLLILAPSIIPFSFNLLKKYLHYLSAVTFSEPAKSMNESLEFNI